MLKLLSFLLRKSRRGIISTALDLLGKGYSAQDIKSLLVTARDHGWKSADLRSMRDGSRRLRSEPKELRKLQELHELGEFRDRLGPSIGACEALALGYGHAKSVTSQQCIDAQGNTIPWYTYPAIDYLRQLDVSSAGVFEFGSGASTKFWTERAREVVSVVHDATCHARVDASARPNARIHLATEKQDYVHRIELEPGKFDIIVIDGAHRPECVGPALKKVSETGFLILNHADWYPGTAQQLRASGLLQVDMQGLGPIHQYGWTTSFFFQPGTHLTPARARQPYPAPAALQQVLDSNVDAATDKPSINDLDDKLSPYLDFHSGIFIEAGANNGFAQSNTYHLENSRGWKGMLVEPMPVLAQEARRNRARSTVFECALVADEALAPTVTMHWCNLMSMVEDHHPSPQDIPERLRSGAAVQSLQESYQIQVPGRTLSSLIDEYNPGREIDFFSLDVEGYETEVLKGLDLTRHKPRRILVETNRLEEVSGMLVPHGYVMEAALSEHDYLFLHETVRK